MMSAWIKSRPGHAGIALALLLATSFLKPLFGKAPPVPAPPPSAPRHCHYVISSWVRSQTNSDDQAAQDRLSEAINQLLPDANTVRAFTQKMLQALREVASKPAKQDPQDHYDYLSVTETLDGSTGRMTVEISLHSVPMIPKHDFRLGPDTPVRIDACTLPQPGDKGERSCQKLEIEEIAEKIKAHDKEHDEGKFEKH